VNLLVQLPNDDFANEELPEVLGMIGAAAVGPVTGILANPVLEERTRVSAASALEEIGRRHPEQRDRRVAQLMRQLEGWPRQSEWLNGVLIDYLVELRAPEAAPLMQAVFEAERADVMIRGDWEDVQVDLGCWRDTAGRPGTGSVRRSSSSGSGWARRLLAATHVFRSTRRPMGRIKARVEHSGRHARRLRGM
jgi:hypothetical protein